MQALPPCFVCFVTLFFIFLFLNPFFFFFFLLCRKNCVFPHVLKPALRADIALRCEYTGRDSIRERLLLHAPILDFVAQLSETVLHKSTQMLLFRIREGASPTAIDDVVAAVLGDTLLMR